MKFFTIVTFIFFATSCASNEFAGDSDNVVEKTNAQADLDEEQKLGNEQEAQTDADPSTGDDSILVDEAEEILAEDGDLSKDDQTILGCIEEWGQANISKNALKGYRKLTANNQGFASSVLKDSKKTDQPRLVLVKAESTGFAGVRMELMNPNGWYCIDVKNVGFSASDLLLHCDAEVAGYSSDNTGFSNSQDTRVGC